MDQYELVGVGLYSPADAQALIGVPSRKIIRWLKGHEANGVWYDPLWSPQIDLGDGAIHLGFRDLLELRTAHQFISVGVSPQQVRKAIVEAKKYLNEERPLSTKRFKTDGRSIFLEIIEEDGDSKLLDLFRKQFAFKRIIEQSLKDVDFAGSTPTKWWVGTRQKEILIDPERAFGKPIDNSSGVPTAVLSQAARTEGDIRSAALAWDVSETAIRRAVRFEESLEAKAA